MPPSVHHYLVGVVLIWIISLSTLAAEAQPSMDCRNCLADSTVDITWSDAAQGLERLRVLAASGHDQEATEWFDLLNDSDGVRAQHLQLSGEVAGQPLDSSPLQLRYVFTSDNTPYHLRLTVSLHNPTENTITPAASDHLYMTLGPGLGDQRAEGLGYAESLYSYIESITKQGGTLLRYRAGDNGNNSFEWQPEDTTWFGLHGRYFALLVKPLPTNGFSDLPAIVTTPTDLNSETITNDHALTVQWPLKFEPIAAGEALEWRFDIFSGPKSSSALTAGGEDYDDILLPGLWAWMRWLSFGLLWLLSAIHMIIPSWGLAIIVLSILVRLLMSPVATRAMRQQKAFVDLQKILGPQLQAIKQNYKGEEQSERILQLYASHGVSPLAGLKPLLIVLIQVPILVALFHGLGSVYELRDASFLWMDTLAEPDKLMHFGFSVPLLGEYLNLLPVLMAVTTLATIKLSPAPVSDERGKTQQNWFLIFMAVGFFIAFYPFPSGMVLYWTMANILHIGQQKLISRKN